ITERLANPASSVATAILRRSSASVGGPPGKVKSATWIPRCMITTLTLDGDAREGPALLRCESEGDERGCRTEFDERPEDIAGDPAKAAHHVQPEAEGDRECYSDRGDPGPRIRADRRAQACRQSQDEQRLERRRGRRDLARDERAESTSSGWPHARERGVDD